MNAKLLSIITKKVWIIIALSLYFAKVFSYDFEVDGLCYNILSENQVEVTYKYVQGDYSGKLVIPEKVKYGGKEYIVSVIGTDAFSWCSGLTGSLVIPNSVTRIGYHAFFNCSGLTGSLTIPNSVTSIGAQAFDGCSSLTGSLIIPNSVTTIMHGSFRGCKFTGSLTIPNSITTIEEHVFDGCSGFTGSLIIPSSVTSIDDGAFNGCSGFTGSLIIPSTVTSIGSSTFYGCSGLTSLIIPSSVASIGYKTFMYCKRLSYVESQMEFPFSFGDDIFLGIASNAILVIPKGESYPYGITKWFAETKRKSDNYILSISSSGNGYASYDGTSIRTKTEEFSLTEGATATITFTPDEGYRIKTVKVNNSTVSVSNNQYTISSIKANTTVNVEFEAIPPTTYTLSVTASGNGSATYSSTTIRNNTRSFTENEGTSATITFSPDDGYRIKTVKVNNSTVSVSNNRYTISSINANTTVSVEFEEILVNQFSVDGFYYKVIEDKTNEVELIQDEVYKNYTGDLVIPENVTYNGRSYKITSIGKLAFYDCSGFTGSLYIPSSMISIGDYAFYGCKGFTGSLTIPNSVNSIGKAAFYNCEGFNGTLTISNNITSIEDYTFSGCKGLTGSLRIPYSINTIGNYAFFGCESFTGSLSIPSSVTSIGKYAFSICSGFTGTLTIPNSVTSIGNYAFGHCSGFTGSLAIPNSVTSIGESAFYGCSGFTGSLYIPSSVTFLGESAFCECRGLTGTLTIPNTVSSIGINTFRSCGFTGSLVIPNSVTSIGDYAFYGCRGFTGSLTIPNTVSLIGKYSFGRCGFTGTLIIPSSVTSIRESAFSLCSGFTGSLSIPASVISIGNSAFMGCRGLTSVFISENVTSIGYSAFQSCNNMILVESQIFEPFSIDDNVFQEISSVAELKVPKGTKTKYEAFSGWTCNFNKINEIDATDSYTLSITVSGNGLVSYDGKTIRDESRSFAVNEGTSLSISITPDEGYQVKSFKVNGSTVSVPTSSYYISSVTSNTTIEVDFEEIPINSDGWYNTYMTCINRTESKIVTGSNVQKTVGFVIANSGKRSVNIKKIVAKHPDTNATLTTSTDMSLLGELKPDSTKALSINLRVDVSPIYEITYTLDNEEYVYDNTEYIILSIIGNKFGVVNFMEASVGDETRRFSIKPGDNATVEFVPNNGCILTKASVKDTDITSNIVGNKYTIVDITSSTSVNAVFDSVSGDSRSVNGHEYVDLGLPSGKYWSTVNYGAKNPEDAGSYLSPDNLENVSSKWGDYWRVPTKDEMQELIDECKWEWTEQNGTNGFVIKGPNGNTMFLPAAGKNNLFNDVSVGSIATYFTSSHDDTVYYWIFEGSSSGMKMSNVWAASYNYPVRPISTVKNESVFSVDGLNFTVVSAGDKTINLAKGNYGKVLEVPATVKYPSAEWKIVGIDKGALSECNELAAIIWNPGATFTESVDNTNLLLYVKSASYAPTSIKNVVVNGVADRITLTDTSRKNDFYCPQEFAAKEVSYTHNYKMETGLGNARGWETIALPFDVQKVTHESKGEIIPFANWKSGDTKKPFWLMTYGANGWTEANSIKAHTPYIISMPNHSNYKSEFRLNGRVTFSAENAIIPVSDDLHTPNYNGKTFIPNYANQSNKNFYALNVNNDLETYNGNYVEGSTFLIGDIADRVIHPFEAYMATISQTRGCIAIDEDFTMDIDFITEALAEEKSLRVYNLNGQLVRATEGKSLDEVKKNLPAGIYIVNGKKIIIR